MSRTRTGAATSVGAAERRSRSTPSRRPEAGRTTRVGALVGRRAREAALAELLGYADGLSVQSRASAEHHWAWRYLQSSRRLSVAPAPMSPAEQARLSYAQAELVARVTVAVLDGLGLSDEVWNQGHEIAMKVIAASSPEDWSPL
jgi:hypothetical protein